MRKITSEAKKAFEAGYNYKNSNTEISGGSYFLFGNKICSFFIHSHFIIYAKK